ncbi:hypothetical protein PGT21_013980 [Puccinia graminis f. sp. tritici]|uniref:Uncharacterized protein n=1 Tax=Puccinia graminis f. sp. tritici TaxID=56615 RepID=A0A5B0Q5T7_PUCGR|nr:hypothetical protein PGT21_013980 [Puccinia graminis f. sp. tritici]
MDSDNVIHLEEGSFVRISPLRLKQQLNVARARQVMKQPINQAAKRIARILGDKATRSQSPRTTATARTKRRTALHPPPLHTESATQPDQHYSPESYKTPASKSDVELVDKK